MDPVELIKIYAGRIAGFDQAAVVVLFKDKGSGEVLRAAQELRAVLTAALAPDARLFLEGLDPAAQENLPELFAGLLTALEMTAGLPTLGRLLTKAQTSGGEKPVLCWETIFPDYSIKFIKYICLSLGKKNSSDKPMGFQAIIDTVSTFIGHSTNLRHLINAAHILQMPVTLISGSCFLLGWGSRSRIINSSSSERTSSFSVSLARDKVATRSLLMRSDLPVSNQRAVHNLAETITVAREIGFPIVIKPRARDGGAGVTTNIRSEADLEEAFKLAAAEGGGVVLERHITGREYRLLIVNERLISVHERVPAQVIGNGKDTVSHLIEQENDRRLRVRQNGFSNIPISLGADSVACLAAQGLDLGSIPDDRQVVRLRMVPKVQTGGAAVPIDPTSVHPEVIAAAKKAARMLRLDIAGVDYIASNHSQAWQNSGGVITEVNAIPQINRFEEFDIHAAFLRAAVPDAGRVPTLLMTDPGPHGVEQLQAILAAARARGLRVGLKLDREDLECQFAGQAHVITRQREMLSILGDRTVDCIIVLQEPADILQHGLALGHFDGVLLSPCQNDGLEGIMSRPLFRRNLGDRLIHPAAIEGLDNLRQIFPPEGLQSYSGQEDMVTLALGLLAPEATTSRGSSATGNRRGLGE